MKQIKYNVSISRIDGSDTTRHFFGVDEYDLVDNGYRLVIKKDKVVNMIPVTLADEIEIVGVEHDPSTN